MRSRTFLLSALLLAVPLLVLQTGCGNRNDNGTDGGTDGGTPGIEGPSNPGSCSDGKDNDNNGATDCNDAKCASDPACTSSALTIPDINDLTAAKHPASGDVVQVKNEIVTAVLLQHNSTTGAAYWDAWIEEQAGGPYSGIQVVGLSTEPAVGDQVDVTATYKVYYGKNELSNPTAWNKTASGVALPAAVKLDATTAGTAVGSGNNASGNQYTGVLVEVDNAKVTDPAVLGSDGKPHGDYQLDGVLDAGNLFNTDYVPALNDSLKSIVGILDFTYSLERLQPRMNEDITLADGSHPSAVAVTIEQIQDASASGHPAAGTVVKISGAVITAMAAPDSKARVHFVVGDPAGGQWSGIYVYNAVGADMSAMAVGDLVDLTGTYTEYTATGDTDSVSEITLKSVTKTGTGAVPAAHVDTGANLATKATAEPWEGVLVEVDNTDVTASTDSYGEATVTGGLKVGGLLFNVGFFITGDHFDKLVGILHWNHGWILEPRSADDFAGTFAQPSVVTIPQIQNAADANHVATGTVVEIDGAIVTAMKPPASNGKVHFYIEDPAGGQWSGIYVYNGGGLDVSSVTQGSAVNLIATYSEYKHLSELNLLALKSVSTGTMPAAAPVTEADFAGTVQGDTNGMEPYEGVLVTLTKDGTSAKMTVDAAANNYGFTVDTKAATVAPGIFAYPATAAEQLTSITGVVDYYDGNTAGTVAPYYSVLPRDAADVVQ